MSSSNDQQQYHSSPIDQHQHQSSSIDHERPQLSSIDRHQSQSPIDRQQSQLSFAQQRSMSSSNDQHQSQSPIDRHQSQSPIDRHQSQSPIDRQQSQLSFAQQRSMSSSNDQQRHQSPIDRQRSQSSIDQERPQLSSIDRQRPQLSPTDRQRPQSPNDQQRHQSPIDRQQSQSPNDQERHQSPNDRQQSQSSSNDQQRPQLSPNDGQQSQSPNDQERHQSPNDRQQSQSSSNDQQRPQLSPNDGQQSQSSSNVEYQQALINQLPKSPSIEQHSPSSIIDQVNKVECNNKISTNLYTIFYNFKLTTIKYIKSYKNIQDSSVKLQIPNINIGSNIDNDFMLPININSFYDTNTKKNISILPSQFIITYPQNTNIYIDNIGIKWYSGFIYTIRNNIVNRYFFYSISFKANLLQSNGFNKINNIIKNNITNSNINLNNLLHIYKEWYNSNKSSMKTTNINLKKNNLNFLNKYLLELQILIYKNPKLLTIIQELLKKNIRQVNINNIDTISKNNDISFNSTIQNKIKRHFYYLYFPDISIKYGVSLSHSQIVYFFKGQDGILSFLKKIPIYRKTIYKDIVITFNKYLNKKLTNSYNPMLFKKIIDIINNFLQDKKQIITYRVDLFDYLIDKLGLLLIEEQPYQMLLPMHKYKELIINYNKNNIITKDYLIFLLNYVNIKNYITGINSNKFITNPTITSNNKQTHLKEYIHILKNIYIMEEELQKFQNLYNIDIVTSNSKLKIDTKNPINNNIIVIPQTPSGSPTTNIYG